MRWRVGRPLRLRRVSRLAAVRVGLSEQKQLVASIVSASSLLGVCDGWKLAGCIPGVVQLAENARDVFHNARPGAVADCELTSPLETGPSTRALPEAARRALKVGENHRCGG